LYEAEDQLDKARSRREDAMRAMRADIEALAVQVNKLDAKLAVAREDDSEAARHRALRESLKGEISELEIVITGKAQLEESLALLNKHKTNDFRTSMLMKWSRPGAARGTEAGLAVGSGGYSPRTLSRKQAELKQLSQDKKLNMSELRDCDDQLEQIELEKARLEEAVDEDADIMEALDELREQLNASKKEKLSQLQLVEQAEVSLAAELGVSVDQPTDTGGVQTGGSRAANTGAMGGSGGSGGDSMGGGVGMDSSTVSFVRTVTGLWKRLEASSIEKLNVVRLGDGLGVKELLKLSNEQIDAVAAELKRTSSTKRVEALDGEVSGLLYDLLMDSCSGRKRLNDYTEGLLVQTAQKLDVFKAAFQATRSNAKAL